MWKIGSLRAVSIGHLILNSILYFEKRHDPRIFLIVINKKKDIVNWAVYEIIKDHYSTRGRVFFSCNIFLYFFKRAIEKVSSKYEFMKKYLVNIEWIHHETIFENLYGSKYRCYDAEAFAKRNIFTVPSKYKSKCEKWKKVMKINGKYICVFARDDHFYGSLQEEKNNLRNSNFKKLKPVLEYLIDNDYWVIRMGRYHAEDDIRIKSNKYIDYGNSDGIDDALDIMLIKECELFLSSNSGITNIQLLFNTRLLLIDWFPIGICPFFLNCTYIPKRYSHNGRFVNYNEIPDELLLCEDMNVFDRYNYSVEENNSNEIFDFVVENINNNNNNIDPTQFDFVVTGKGGMLCSNWYDSNPELFS